MNKLSFVLPLMLTRTITQLAPALFLGLTAVIPNALAKDLSNDIAKDYAAHLGPLWDHFHRMYTSLV